MRKRSFFRKVTNSKCFSDSIYHFLFLDIMLSDLSAQLNYRHSHILLRCHQAATSPGGGRSNQDPCTLSPDQRGPTKYTFLVSDLDVRI